MLKLVRQWPTVISIAANIYSRVYEIRTNKVLRCKICSVINLIQVTAEICIIALDQKHMSDQMQIVQVNTKSAWKTSNNETSQLEYIIKLKFGA